MSHEAEKENVDEEIFFLMERFNYTAAEATEHYVRQMTQRQIAADRAQAKIIRKAMLRKDQQNFLREARPELFDPFNSPKK
jgi:hypothetical protein